MNMTLEEKARLVNGASFFGTTEIKRLGIPRIQILDGGTGINFEQLFGDLAETLDLKSESTNGMTGGLALIHVIDYFYMPDKLTEDEYKLYLKIKAALDEITGVSDYAPACFPAGMGLGATWNPDVVYEVGIALGYDANLYGVQLLLGTPNVNVHRDPRNGRLFEGYSEDPCLVKILAPNLVKGVQSRGVAANVKHFAANNQETNRVGINEVIPERALEEIYFPGFKACVQEGNVLTVMSAYNQINGVACTENKWLLEDKLRGEWGFHGMVISDWGAVYNPVAAIMSGNDLAMPGPRDWKPIVDAVNAGKLQEAELDKAVNRVLKLIEWITVNKPENNKTGENNKIGENNCLSSEKVRKLTDKAAYNAAAEGIVLLKNENILPLTKEQKVALSGNEPNELLACGTGSAGITTNRNSSLLMCLAASLGEENIVSENEDVVLYVYKETGMEGNDRKTLLMRDEDVSVIKQYDKPVILILNTCGPVIIPDEILQHIKGIVCVFLPGMAGGEALADILVGKVNPSGKLPLTFPKKETDMPTYINFPGDGYKVYYGEGIFVGYRYYDTVGVKPMFPFGFGLSYTSFNVSDMIASATEDSEMPYEITVCIENTGDVEGAQVLQLYISDPYSTLMKPPKELKAFKKINLKPGEKKQVSFSLNLTDFESYDPDKKMWIAEEGYYDIYVSTSSDTEDICCSSRVYLDVTSPYSYGLNSTIKTFFEKPELKELLFKFWDSKKYDKGILLSNYQYTSHRTLREILPDAKADGLEEFQSKISEVKKL